MSNLQRITFNVTEQENNRLNELSAERGRTKSTLIREGIHLVDWWDGVTGRGATILVQEPNGKLREIVRR